MNITSFVISSFKHPSLPPSLPLPPRPAHHPQRRASFAAPQLPRVHRHSCRGQTRRLGWRLLPPHLLNVGLEKAQVSACLVAGGGGGGKGEEGEEGEEEEVGEEAGVGGEWTGDGGAGGGRAEHRPCDGVVRWVWKKRRVDGF